MKQTPMWLANWTQTTLFKLYKTINCVHIREANKVMETILVLEKENNLRTLYKEELEEEGYQILLAKNDKEALKMVEENNLDLIITDYHIPPTSFYMSMLHTANKIKDIPVIILSGYPRNRVNFALNETIEYLIKSPDLKNFKNKVRRMLYRNKLIRPLQVVNL